MTASAFTGKLGVIGAGVMGRALIAALIEQGVIPAAQVWAAAKSEKSCQRARQSLGIDAFVNYRQALADTAALLLCVKPYQLADVVETLKKYGLPAHTLIISIVAGKTLASIETQLVTPNPVIRAMPNTPCMVGQGMTVFCPGSFAEEAHLETARQIFEAFGECLQLEEHHFDAATGLGGSGPAYLYLIMEALADGGVRVGLPRDVALAIVSQTVLGAATMVKRSGRHPAALRDDVTTPAGCTIAGLLTLEDGKIRSVLARAVQEAARTAAELGARPH
ncbi:MAG: pyrroline-5-carboxylate reductase [Vampirovibrionales bacterium]|nr:pyrroline-5-carboxylate reductase [Vampirovibrionales bacterium]